MKYYSITETELSFIKETLINNKETTLDEDAVDECISVLEAHLASPLKDDAPLPLKVVGQMSLSGVRDYNVYDKDGSVMEIIK